MIKLKIAILSNIWKINEIQYLIFKQKNIYLI